MSKTSGAMNRLLLLAHEGFPDRAKTAVGLLRYGDNEVVGVVDREIAASDPDASVNGYIEDVIDAPIFSRVDEAPPFDTLVIGVAPIGGGFDMSWRPDIKRAFERGADVWAGLHYLLSEDQEFAELAAQNNADIWDIREPPADLTVAKGIANDLDATVVLTVGSDCSTGKMTTAVELAEGARERGWDAGFVPTGQTGVLLAGAGIVVDRTISDYTAGATERMVVDAAADHDYVFVEGQGAITHPAYSAVTCGILHGAMPDAMVLCHEAGRQSVHGYEAFPIADLEPLIALYEDLASAVHQSEVVAGAVNTQHLAEPAARRAVESFTQTTNVPATDPVRFGVDEVLDEL